MKFGTLRAINDDCISPYEGFGQHPHTNYEIFSYILAGEMEHRDSLSNMERLKRGDVQFTSSGSGIMHSEFNVHDKDNLYLLQIWVIPSENGLKPSYTMQHFTDEEKTNTLRPIVAPNGQELNCININQGTTTYASILEKDKRVTYSLQPNRKALIQLVTLPNRSIRVTNGHEDVLLEGGDVLMFKDRDSVTNITIDGNSDEPTEFVFIDICNEKQN
jgi:hypothetical protein